MNVSENPPTKIWVSPEGYLPLAKDLAEKRDSQRKEDVGINVSVRAIIGIESKTEQGQREENWRRKTLFDFVNPAISCREILPENIRWRTKAPGTSYILGPKKSVSLGLGIVVEIPPGWAWYVEPRSSTVRKHDRDCVLSVLNANVPGDPGFRGEVWAELYNHGPGDFEIHRHAVLFQLVRKRVDTARPVIVADYDDLSKTDRGWFSNGHTTEEK